MRLEENIFTEEVKYLFKILSGDGDGVRLVGGCVRDFLVGRKIYDYDLATRHRPDQLIAILEKNGLGHLDLGKEFGTVTALLNGRKFEITSLRRDIRPDGRHTAVEFTDDYREDAQRRDFTFNALYCDSSRLVHDYFGGVGDLRKGLLRFIGDPEERILEDHLRILRFFRFYSSHCYSMDHRALAACRKHRDKIDKLSKERIAGEMRKILECRYPLKVLGIMERCGILQKIFNPRGEKMKFSALEIFYSLRGWLDFDYNYLFILALILSENTLDYDLKLKNKEKAYLNLLLENIPEHLDYREIERLLFRLGDPGVVKAIIILHSCGHFTGDYGKYLDFLAKTEIPKLDLTAEDLARHGFGDRRSYGKLLRMARNIFLDSEFRAKKEKIIEMLKNDA
ncbi:MAG: CCA tRNA nucleotidyltransferase [Rickettsiales bacterium]|jgi:poly(A) polymerase|nr:CCA tRNA nucleotidyltransferase [Rickettsiales bacterium]